MRQKIRFAFAILSIVLYICFAVATFAGHTFYIELFSPLTTFICVVMILLSLPDLGKFRICAIACALGIGSWCVADVILFINDFYFGLEEPRNALVRAIYLIPNYLYGAAVIVFLMIKLKKTNLYITAANTFLLTVASFSVVAKLVQASGGLVENDPATLRAYLYFFVNIVIVVVGVHILYMVGAKNLLRGTNLVPICILGYILIDFRYSYLEAIGKEAESIYFDVLYMFFMLGLAWGILFQSNIKYVYRLKEGGEKERRMIYVRILIPLLIIAVAALRVADILSRTEFSYIIIALLAYFIMYALLQNSSLNEKLLIKQQELNTSLEAQVAEKTHDLKKANENLKVLSSTDILTGLYNRRHGMHLFDILVKESEEEKKSFAVFEVDLNHFKPVNDTYGHEMGDRVLEEFGRRMRELPERFISIRNGGDEFAILCADVKDRADVTAAAKTLQRLFNEPLILDSFAFRLSGSIGISIYPDDSTNPEDLLQYADAAMYTVKRSKNRDGFRFFDAGLVVNVERRRKIEEHLKKANPDKDFLLHFQPQYDVNEETIVGVEVFPRLLIPGLEDCTPAELIPIAEESGVMSKLGIWTALTALKQVDDWNKKYGLELTTTINLAPLQLLDADFIENLAGAVELWKLDPASIILDVSNEVMMGAAESAKETLHTFHEFGYTLSLNEFGGGDINLSYIRDCGFSIIKLSRALIPQGIGNPKRLEIIHALLALAKELKVDVVAVGIETKAQVELMRELGIRIMQGFFYSKPLTAEELENTCLFGALELK
ncbi:MAG: EAL domain-containing protein [Lachnospiraceae bacterium]|nr:EAL domain-containing protein [Lachnospiraceae bacterium]